jgi:NTE family protein
MPAKTARPAVSPFGFRKLEVSMTRTNRIPGAFSRRCVSWLRVGLVLFAVIATGAAAIAQTEAAQTAAPAKKRLTIGVALEGGGAMGLAHIGVLRWFEQHHIPVDYIAGTSMGGLVGGLYATGHSPDQIQTLVERMDWPLVIDGTTPYPELSYRRKQDDRAIPTDIAIGFKKGPSLPSGLNAGHQISLVIDKETLDYSMVESLGNLPIPFRCVSTDLITGKEHVFTTGPVGQAMRSTMAFPGVFAPVRQGNALFVDGALTDNLPTDVVRDMKADIVIAVHLQQSPTTVDQINGLFGVLGRSVSIGIANSELRGMENADIVVKVDVSKYSAMDYDQAVPLIEKGTEAAVEKANVLLPYALNQADWDAYIAARDARKLQPAPPPQFVKVEGSTPALDTKIHKALQSMAGKPIDVPTFENHLTQLTGLGRFDSVGYSLTKENGQVGLLVVAHEKDNAPPLLQLGFEVDGAQPDDVTFTLAGRMTFIDVAGFGSELRNDFQFGNTYGITSEFYKRFSATSKFFYAPRVTASRQEAEIYLNNNPIANYRFSQVGGVLDLGYAASRFTEVRAGYGTGYKSDFLRLGLPEFLSVDGRTGFTEFSYDSEHVDDPIIPRLGYLAKLNFEWFDTSPGAATAFPKTEASVSYFKPVSQRASVFVIADGGTTFGYRDTGVPQFLFGGPPGWAAYGPNEIRGNQYYLFRPGYLHKLLSLPPFLGSNVYGEAFFEVGKMYAAPGVSRLPTDGAAGIIARTAIGPLFLGGAVGDTGHAKWFFSLGRVF